jgi:hypothetical protein
MCNFLVAEELADLILISYLVLFIGLLNIHTFKNMGPSDGSQNTYWRLSQKGSNDFDHISAVYRDHLPK